RGRERHAERDWRTPSFYAFVLSIAGTFCLPVGVFGQGVVAVRWIENGKTITPIATGGPQAMPGTFSLHAIAEVQGAVGGSDSLVTHRPAQPMALATLDPVLVNPKGVILIGADGRGGDKTGPV